MHGIDRKFGVPTSLEHKAELNMSTRAGPAGLESEVRAFYAATTQSH